MNCIPKCPFISTEWRSLSIVPRREITCRFFILFPNHSEKSSWLIRTIGVCCCWLAIMFLSNEILCKHPRNCQWFKFPEATWHAIVNYNAKCSGRIYNHNLCSMPVQLSAVHTNLVALCSKSPPLLNDNGSICDAVSPCKTGIFVCTP